MRNHTKKASADRVAKKQLAVLVLFITLMCTSTADILLNSSDETGNSSINVQSSETTLEKKNSKFHMYETDEATFAVSLNGVSEIEWLIDGKAAETDFGQEGEFTWVPGILYTDNYESAVISAHAGNQTESWIIEVENAMNPYFTSTDGSQDDQGRSDTQVHVMTKNAALHFDSISVTIASKAGNTSYSLDKFPGENQVDWRKDIFNITPGNNIISEIKAVTGNSTVVYKLGNERAHYRSIVYGSVNESDNSSDSGFDRRRSRRPDSSSEYYSTGTPRLIYAIFDKSIIHMNDTQILRLDAKNFAGGVMDALALIETPSGETMQVELSLVKGSREYGTWEVLLLDFEKGHYTLKNVELWNSIRANTVPVENVTFYVLGDDPADRMENLTLIYSYINKNRVKNGTDVTLRIDASDGTGITEAIASAETSRGANLSFPLSLVKGDEQYGTCEGNFTVSMPDTTYIIRNITLFNEREEKTFPINNSRVYVNPVPRRTEPVVTGSSAAEDGLSFEDLIQNPLVPTLIGFGLMVVIVVIAIVITRKDEDN